MIELPRETAMAVLDILADLPYREVEAVFKVVALAVIDLNNKEGEGAIKTPDTEIIVPLHKI